MANHVVFAQGSMPVKRGRKCPKGRKKVCGGRGKKKRCFCVKRR